MKKGFTLIEMILVVAMVTILCGVVFLGSLSTFKSSKVEGFSNEALSLIRQLYDYQSTESKFVDQVTPNGKEFNLESTYNLVFEVDTAKNEITVRLRNGTSQIDQALISNMASIKDMTVKFYEKVLKDDTPKEAIIYPQGENPISKYILSFDSKGRILRKVDSCETNTLKSLRIEINIKDSAFERNVIITTPPAGNIVLEKRGEN